MKSAMILCALVTVCCFSTGNAADNAGTAALTKLKSELETTTNDLSSYRKNLVRNTQSKLADSKMFQLVMMYDITHSPLDAIRSEIDQAILAGKNADPCFEPSEERMRQESRKTQVVLDKCSIDALATVYPVESSMDTLLKQADRLNNQLSAIPINCMSSDAAATENCITDRSSEARSAVDAYRNDASSLKQNGDRTSSHAQRSASGCYLSGVQALRDVTNSIRSEAHQSAGAPCTDQKGCSTMTNAECRQDVCTCKDNFMIDMNNSSNCIMRPKAAGDICQRNDDCKDSMEMALCINNRCICYTDYRFVNETGTCMKMRGLYQPCKRNYQCFLDETRPNALECKNGECACRQANCSNGSTVHRPIFTVLATLAVGTAFRKFV